MNFNFSEPVDHVLERAGFCSNRSFKNFIKIHKVEVSEKSVGENNPEKSIVVSSRDFLFNSQTSNLFIDGKKISIPLHLYILLNKPENVVCSRVSDRHKTVFDFLPSEIKNHPFYEHLHVAGRLDSDSHGLVLLTTNGSFSASLVKPETHVEKTYKVKLQKKLSIEEKKDFQKAFASGIRLPEEKKGKAFFTKPAVLSFNENSSDEESAVVKITEGKFRQIRRMFSVLGNEVTDLKRVSIGDIKLPEDLPEGHCKIFEL